MSVPARRRQVAYSRERGLSARRACTLFSVARSALSYQARKAAKDAAVVERMKELSAHYPRYGYRRVRIFLARDGYRMSPGRAYRLWRTARLQVPRKRPKKRVAAVRPRPQVPCGPNQVWSYDFVFDHCANGQQLKCLTVTDEFTKEGLAIDVDDKGEILLDGIPVSGPSWERALPWFETVKGLRHDKAGSCTDRRRQRWCWQNNNCSYAARLLCPPAGERARIRHRSA